MSPAPDCTGAVLYDERAPQDDLRIDLVADLYGIGKASWR